MKSPGLHCVCDVFHKTRDIREFLTGAIELTCIPLPVGLSSDGEEL